MNVDHPHEIERRAGPGALEPKPSDRRRWFPLTDAEGAELEGKNAQERAAWLNAWHPFEYLARHLEAACEIGLAERARRGEFVETEKGSHFDRVLTIRCLYAIRSRARAGEFASGGRP